VIITGEDVKYGKPNPEVYYKSLNILNCSSEDAIVFEDSNIGCEAAENAGISYIKITKFS
jgi:beta-phosphoglucomutase